jgi:hypothetical protein
VGDRVKRLSSWMGYDVIYFYVRFEFFAAVNMKNGVFLDVIPCGSCKNQRFGGTLCLHHQGDKNR